MGIFFSFLDKWVGRLGNIAIFSSIMLTVLYFVSPDTRRWVELHLTNRQAWYFVGKIYPPEGRWAKYVVGKNKRVQNFYHVNWEERRAGVKRTINQKVINSAIGDLLVHTSSNHVMGRDSERNGSRDQLISNNRAIIISLQYDCLVPWYFKFVDSNGNRVDDDTTKITYVLMKATKVTCQ